MLKGLDMKELIEKAKEMQKTIAQKKEEAATKTVDVNVGGGMVQIIMNGNLEALSVKIDPEIVDKNDVETLEDLVRAAVNEAVRQSKELISSGLSDLIPGFDLSKLTDLK